MSLPIKPTPVLKGKEAKEFSKKINSNKNRPVSKEELEKISKAFDNVIFKGIVRL